MKKYWLIIALVVAVCVSVFFNIKIALTSEIDEQEKIVAEAYGAEFAEISREASKLNFTQQNCNFITNLTMQALIEKPFETKNADRVGVVKKIVAELESQGVASLPEQFRIELFLDRFVKYVPGSEFLTPAEYDEKYGYDPEKAKVIADICEKFENATYAKFPKFIADETIFSFRVGMQGIMETPGMPAKLVLDLRRCLWGQMELGASLAECLYKINYESLKETRDRLYFKIPAELLFQRIRRPFNACPDYKWQDIYFYTVNPIFTRMVDNKDPGIYFDQDTISVKRKTEVDFKTWTVNFNSFVDSLEIFILVDGKTSGPAELFAALLKNKFADKVIIIGEPTVGEITMRNVYEIAYREDRREENGSGKRKPVYFQIQHGKPLPNNPASKDMTRLGWLILIDGYWHNPEMNKKYNLKDIHLGGITPDYLVFSEDGEGAMINTVRDLLNKSRQK
ncbi:MAG: hypothetical protein US76_02540 [Parcubacteria group bacterium GW2011_GWA2_38_13b]|nr:MAG: hypothetical protein US76_02540 [Parcubacteria group bacterium GW2011_GWA2_38_13b]